MSSTTGDLPPTWTTDVWSHQALREMVSLRHCSLGSTSVDVSRDRRHVLQTHMGSTSPARRLGYLYVNPSREDGR